MPSSTCNATATETTANSNHARSRTLRIGGLARKFAGRQFDFDDEAASLQHRLALRMIARQDEEIFHRRRTPAACSTANPDNRVQGDQRDGQV